MAALASLASIQADSVVAGKYRITRLIKAGGMGEVYEAKHLRLGRRVAIKFLRSQLLQDPVHHARFEREAAAAGALEHENIATIIDVGNDEQGTPFIVMEYLDGETLRTVIEQRAPLPVPRAVAITLQICAGLSVAHAQGVIHRDLKPENLVVCRRSDGRDWIKLLDFGVARLLDTETQTEVTATGVVVGTAHYMSPEQARGESIDARTDVHAVGAILYELLSGRKAHPGETYNTVIYHVLSKELTALDSLRASLPAQLVTITHRALAPDATDRYASIAELAKALERFIAVTEPRASAGAEPSTTLETTGSRQVRLPVKRLTTPWALAIAVLVVVCLLGLSFFNGESAEKTDLTLATPTPAPATQQPKIAQPTAAQPALAQPTLATAQPTTAPPTISALPVNPAPPASLTAPAAPLPVRKTKPRAAAPNRLGSSTVGTATPPATSVPEGFVDSPYGQ